MTKKAELKIIDGGKAAEPLLKLDTAGEFNNWLLDMEQGTVFLAGPATGPQNAFLTTFIKGPHSPSNKAVMLFNTEAQKGMWANATTFPNLYRNYDTVGKVDPRTLDRPMLESDVEDTQPDTNPAQEPEDNKE